MSDLASAYPAQGGGHHWAEGYTTNAFTGKRLRLTTITAALNPIVVLARGNGRGLFEIRGTTVNAVPRTGKGSLIVSQSSAVLHKSLPLYAFRWDQTRHTAALDTV